MKLLFLTSTSSICLFFAYITSSANSKTIFNCMAIANVDTPRSYELYNSPVFELTDHFFSEKNRWSAPTPGSDDDIVYYGPTANQKIGSFTAVVGFVYDRLHIAAENKIYAESLGRQLDLANEELNEGTGILLKYNIYYNSEGQSNLYSLDNVQTMGIGSSPEEALINQPLFNIIRNDYSTSFPTLNSHYVFIFKNKNQNIEISKIVDPFKGKLIEKASELKIESLKNINTISQYTNEYIDAFDMAEAWQENYKTHKSTIEKSNYNSEIQRLNAEMNNAQKEFNHLKQLYVKTQNLNNTLGTLISFVEICQDISSSFNKNSTTMEKDEMSLYETQHKYTEDKITSYLPKLKESSKRLLKIDGDLRGRYRRLNLPPPKQIPLL